MGKAWKGKNMDDSSTPLKSLIPRGATRVGDVMTGEVTCLKPDDSFEQAVSLMANRHFHHFVAIDGSGRIAGVISDRDILRALARAANWRTKTVGEIMTRDPLTVNPETPLCDAVATMLSQHINCLPVIHDDGTVCGILTSTDVLRSYQQLLEQN
jgi:CBS domain-containing protein